MNCKIVVRHKLIVLEDGEGKTKMYFSNPQQKKIIKIRVDGCLVTKGKRCDFMLLDHNSIEHYIELKGKKVLDACEQIEETIKQLSVDRSAFKRSFIVSTACPLTTTQIQVLKSQFRKKYNSLLFIKNSHCEHCID